METPPSGVVTARKHSPWLWVFVVVIISGALITALTVPLPGRTIDSELRPLSDTENEYVNRTDGYTLPVPVQWRIFNEITYPERRNSTPDTIREQLSLCGAMCAAFSIVTMGTYSSVPCETEACSSGGTSNGVSLTIYGLANPNRLDIDTFLSEAFLMAPDSQSVYTIIFGDDEEAGVTLEGRMERIFNEDESELRTYFFGLDERVYFFDQDTRTSGELDQDDLFNALQRAVGLITLE